MNLTLNRYQESKKVKLVTGYNPLISISENYKYDIYLSPRSSSLGGALFNLWSIIDGKLMGMKNLKNYKKRLLFNSTGFDRAKRLDRQIKKGNNSWSILFGFNLFLNSKLCAYPVNSKLKHIGWDGSGTHESIGTNKFNNSISESNYPLRYPEKIFLNDSIINKKAKLYGNSIKIDSVILFYIKILCKKVLFYYSIFNTGGLNDQL